MKLPRVHLGLALVAALAFASAARADLTDLAVTRGTGRDAAPALLRIERGTNKVSAVELKDVTFSKVELPNANEKRRQEAITSLGYAGGKLYVAGISNEEFASTLRAIPFPFKEADRGTGIQIFHGAHGQLETRSPVQTFTPFDIKGEAHLLAAYTCTPLVKIPVSELKPGAKVKGTTVAELGNGNKPLDMVVYEKGGKRYVLMANSRRGVMKISTEAIDSVTPITERVEGGGTAGLKYEKISDLKGVVQLAKLDAKRALILTQAKDGAMNLNTIDLP
ncbi:MAG: hypothetical protein HYS12_27540 [Planctomycetes bacterium]|nr:hypothetical protein [Planctomycetota bacterium]